MSRSTMDRLRSIQQRVDAVTDDIRDDIMDIQHEMEGQGEFSRLTMNDELDGPPFVLSEDAAPWLDAAVASLEHAEEFLQEAIDNIEEHYKWIT